MTRPGEARRRRQDRRVRTASQEAASPEIALAGRWSAVGERFRIGRHSPDELQDGQRQALLGGFPMSAGLLLISRGQLGAVLGENNTSMRELGCPGTGPLELIISTEASTMSR